MLMNALSVIIGLLGTIALSGTLSFELEKTAYTNSTVAFLFLLMAVIILRYVYLHLEYKDKWGALLSALYAFGLSFALTAGKQLHTVENFDVGNLLQWLQMILIALFFHGPVWYLLQWFAKKNNMQTCEKEQKENDSVSKGESKKQNVKTFLLFWLIIFICWIPVFFAFYPGAFVYDAQDEYVQVATREFTTHHPLLHVLMLGGSVCFGNKFLGSYNAGIALYTILQMLVLSGVFAYTVSYLRRYLSDKWCMGITLAYGLFPVFPMYAVCSAKDTLFNAAFLVMLVQLFKMCEPLCVTTTDNEKETGEFARKQLPWKMADVILFVAASAFMMLLRNNGVIAYVALLLGVVVTAIVKYKKTKLFVYFAACMLVSLVLYRGVDKGLALVLQADDSESQELLTVPIQQLARTYKYSPEVFSDEEKQILFAYVPEDVLAVYDADLSDLVKANFNNERYSKNSSEFLGLWAKTFVKKPVTYLNAWLMTSYGYWYPDTVINVYGGQQRFTFQYGDSSYFGFETELPGERDSKFPWLEEQYRKMSLELYQQNVPGISMLFSPGFLFWVFLGSLLLECYTKQYARLLPMMAILLLWGSVIPGPTFLVRYVLILWFTFPLWIQPLKGKIRNEMC